jgi:hypothetical protein
MFKVYCAIAADREMQQTAGLRPPVDPEFLTASLTAATEM